jgi:tetratricopeptide (TPR) repeat protein
MPRKKRKNQVARDLFIVGDFIKYFLWLFIPFALMGLVYGLLNHCYFICILVNPLIYAAGIATIIIIIKHDANDLLALIGHAKENQLARHIKYSATIQKISVEMSSGDYDGALKTVSKLLKEEPDYPNALNLKGQILLEGFREYEQARVCFARVMKLSKPDSDDYRLAEAFKAATFPGE